GPRRRLPAEALPVEPPLLDGQARSFLEKRRFLRRLDARQRRERIGRHLYDSGRNLAISVDQRDLLLPHSKEADHAAARFAIAVPPDAPAEVRMNARIRRTRVLERLAAVVRVIVGDERRRAGGDRA